MASQAITIRIITRVRNRLALIGKTHWIGFVILLAYLTRQELQIILLQEAMEMEDSGMDGPQRLTKTMMVHGQNSRCKDFIWAILLSEDCNLSFL